MTRWWRTDPGVPEFRFDSLRLGDIGDVAALLGWLDDWLRQHDVMLSSVRSYSTLRNWVRDQANDPAIRTVVVRDGAGRARAYAATYLWEVAEHSELRGFYGSRNGVVPIMALPMDAPEDIEAIASVLIAGLEGVWDELGTTGEVLTVPTCLVDAVPEISSTLSAAGIPESFVQAFRPLGPLPPSPYPPPSDVTVRLARPADEDAIAALHVAEVAFHVPYCPTVRVVPEIEASFRRQLARVWAGAKLSSDVPLVVVAERSGEVVGMAESYLQGGDGASPWPITPGRYGYLNSVGVRADQRGTGVGRTLIAGTLARLEALGVEGYTLYYLPANPLSSRFWPQLGFRPVLTRFQWRRD